MGLMDEVFSARPEYYAVIALICGLLMKRGSTWVDTKK